METPIGRCSLCGGTVVKETGPYWSVVPPVAHCQKCHGVEAAPARVIPMERPTVGWPLPQSPSSGGLTYGPTPGLMTYYATTTDQGWQNRMAGAIRILS